MAAWMVWLVGWAARTLNQVLLEHLEQWHMTVLVSFKFSFKELKFL